MLSYVIRSMFLFIVLSTQVYAATFSLNGKTYKIVSLLGKGSSSSVYLVESGDEVKAAKFTNSGNVPPKASNPIDFYHEFLKKQGPDSRLHIPEFAGYANVVFNTGDRPGKRYIVEVSDVRKSNLRQLSFGELGLRGDISSAEIESRLERALRMVHDVSQGLTLLHKNGYLHLDLKPDNILIDDNGHAEIADWGLIIDSNRKRLTADQIFGTFGYIDPAIFKEHRYSFKNDYYSFGSMIWEVLIGRSASDTVSLWDSFTLPKNYNEKNQISRIISENYDQYFNNVTQSVDAVLDELDEASKLTPRAKQIYLLLRELTLTFMAPEKNRFSNLSKSHLKTVFWVRAKTAGRERLEYQGNVLSMVKEFGTLFPRVGIMEMVAIPTCRFVSALSSSDPDKGTRLFEVRSLVE